MKNELDCIQSVSNCIICKKSFSHYGDKIVCSSECQKLYIQSLDLLHHNSKEFRSFQESENDSIFWVLIRSILFSGSKVVRKGWGFEVHITNNPDYCLKYLVFFENKKFSLHYHAIKKELWHCLIGSFDCHLENGPQVQIFKFNKGEKIEVVPGLIHQLTALENSIIVEVSTQDFPEDSIRLIKGD